MPEQLQMPMEEILSDKPVEKTEKLVQVETRETPEKKEEVKEVKEVERVQSKKQLHRDREQEAHGRVRDPETGQYVAKESKESAEKAEKVEQVETKEDKTAAPQQEVKETKPEPKQEVKQELTDKEKAFLRAMEEERRKRQEWERKIAAGEYVKATPGQPAATTEPAKTFWDDPEGALAKHRAEIGAQVTTARLNTAELIGRERHKDFDEKVAVFGKLLGETPGLYERWMAAPDPGEFAYVTADRHLKLEQAGSIEALSEKIRKEERLKLEAELKEKAEKLEKERAALPPSLSDQPSKGVNRPTWQGPTPMDQILKG